jgi:hypothetical protein
LDELIKLAVKKTGLSEAVPKQIIEVVVDFLKYKLPGPLAIQIDGALESGGLSNTLSGLLDKD